MSDAPFSLSLLKTRSQTTRTSVLRNEIYLSVPIYSFLIYFCHFMHVDDGQPAVVHGRPRLIDNSTSQTVLKLTKLLPSVL